MLQVAAQAASEGYTGIIVIEGEAEGADTIAREIAEAEEWTVERYPALWAEEGSAAGPKRNRRMLDAGRPDEVIAFPLGRATGTQHMARIAQAAGVKVWLWNEVDQFTLERHGHLQSSGVASVDGNMRKNQ